MEKNEWMDGWMDGKKMNGWMGGKKWMDGWIDGKKWMDGWMEEGRMDGMIYRMMAVWWLEDGDEL